MSTHRKAWYVINGITLYRIVTAPLLLILLFSGFFIIFKWLLAVSFFTDLIDGFLARKFKVASVLGTRLDSIGDDLTVLVAVTGLITMKPWFIEQQKIILITMLILFLVQVGYAFIRYRKMTGFHTYLAKTAALLQGIFLLLVFFTDKPNMLLFYAAAVITIIQLIEEIILVRLLPKWETNVKGIYWVLKNKTI
jgi:CDP-diacylglycerol--glycerol-3-phosphate 3-phosphatidyltransferase